MKKEIINNSFVFYATNLEVIEALEDTNPDLANEFMKAIIEYGIYGQYEKSNPMIDILMIQAGFGIDKAKDRYTAAIENGKKGGRKKEINDAKVLELKEKGLTNQQVADELGCSTKTIERANKRNREASVMTTDKTDKTPQNLNDNDNDNDNANDNLNDEVPAVQKKKGVEEMERRMIKLPIGDTVALSLDEAIAKFKYSMSKKEVENLWYSAPVQEKGELILPKTIEDLEPDDREYYNFLLKSNIEEGMEKDDAARDAWEMVLGEIEYVF